jgi:transposase
MEDLPMSLKPKKIADIPEETRRIAGRAFPKGNIYMQMRDELGILYEDADFSSLFSSRGQPAYSPWRLTLVCIMQYVANLSDRQAAEAVRARIDWKYALSLELDDPGFDYSVLSEFRTRLLDGGMEQHILDAMLTRFQECGLVKHRGSQRTDSTHIMAAVRLLNRIESIGETLRAALNSLAISAPEWLRKVAHPDWYDRYGKRIEEYNLPKEKDASRELVQTMAEDGMTLLEAVYSEDSPDWLKEIPAVEFLRQKWVQQFYVVDGKICMRNKGDLPPSSICSCSPYDTEAHYCDRNGISWNGYRVHLTETCDDDAPRLITNVRTTIAPQSDLDATIPVHEALSTKGHLPSKSMIDSGYINAESLVAVRDNHGVELIGPMRPDVSWQAREGGYVVGDFELDWENKKAICPQGEVNDQWKPRKDRYGNPLVFIRFPPAKCRVCDSRSLCTRHKSGFRALSIHPQAQHLALQAARKRQKTPEWAEEYRKRAGIEGAFSQGVRTFGLRQARYIGLSKTHLQNIFTAAAINIVRFSNWVSEVPLAKTRISAFAALKPLAA